MSFTGLAYAEILMDGKWHIASTPPEPVFYEKRGRINTIGISDLLELQHHLFFNFEEPGSDGAVDLMPTHEILGMLSTNEDEYLTTGGKSLWNGNGFLMYDLKSLYDWRDVIQEEKVNMILVLDIKRSWT